MSADNRAKLLHEAIEITTSDRSTNYGEPEDNFRTIADYWMIYLRSRGLRVGLEPYDVAAMMDLVKTARLAVSPSKRDHWLDKAGYAACGWDCVAPNIGLSDNF